MATKELDVDRYLSMTDVERAYIAGFFDGEGLVGVYRHKNKFAKNGLAHEVRVSMTQKKREVLDWIASRLGGNIRWGKDVWIWELHGNKQCPLFLRLIVKYTIVKRDQIEMALQFCKAYQEMTVEQKDNVVEMIKLAKKAG